MKQAAMTKRAVGAMPLDVDRDGITERAWISQLSSVRAWQPAPGPLLVVSPHPGDEVFGAGGLIHSWAEAGHPVTVLSVTDGEAAYSGWRGLGDIRRQELTAALRQLATKHVSLMRLAIPDGRAQEYQNKLRNFLLSVTHPGITMVAPFERDGHSDYDSIGSVCSEIARITATPLAKYLVWRWHQGDPGALHTETWGKFALGVNARHSKTHALQSFGSQLRPPRYSPAVTAQALRCFERPFEAFVLNRSAEDSFR